MGHFAKIDENNIVVQVIVAEQAFIDSGAVGDPAKWIQTSYNTRAGVHYDQDGKPDGGIPLRKNFAGRGYTYDADRDAFIPPKPFDSWILNEDTCVWDPPTDMPNDGQIYQWNESTTSWEPIPTTGE